MDGEAIAMDGPLLATQPLPQQEPFEEFGETLFAAGPPRLERIDLNKPRHRIRREIRAACPNEPGVYGMVDRQQQLIYVGVSRRIRQRLLTYFLGRTPRGKELRIASHARQLVWEPSHHEFTALLRELELIRRWQPRFNVKGKPRRGRRGYLFLTTEQAARFRVDGKLPGGCRMSWGPLPVGRRTQAAVARLNHFFRLRDCPRGVRMRFADQRQLFADPRRPECLRGMLDTCLAPCAGKCTGHQYRQQIEVAQAFLEGRSAGRVLDELESRMQQAAAEQHFERAALLRDTWDDLSYLDRLLELARDVQDQYHFVYPVPSESGGTLWYLIAGGRVASVVAAPDSAETAAACLSHLEAVYHDPPLSSDSTLSDFDETRVVASWFRRNPVELAKTLSPGHAREMCRANETS
jgi:excinuclease ABC subunit C